MSANKLPGFDQLYAQLFRTEYGPWRKHWALLPVRTLGGRTVWCDWVYERNVYRWRFDKRSFSRTEYADDFDLLTTAE